MGQNQKTQFWIFHDGNGEGEGEGDGDGDVDGGTTVTAVTCCDEPPAPNFL